MPKLAVLDIQGKEVESINLPDEVFGGKVNTDIIHQAVVMYRASSRQGTASTKTSGEMSGGGKKPFRQKGTGRARAGSSRSPLWHGGGIVFGPHPRDYSYSIPKQMKKAALRESINAKFQSNDLICIVDIDKTLEKTKDFAKILKTLNIKGKILALLEGSNPSIERVSKNIRYFNIMRAKDVTAYDILRFKKILATKTSFKTILDRVIK